MKHVFSLFIILLISVNPLLVNAEEVVLAGGCFWCLEHDLESLNGINDVMSGYSGSDLMNPSYENHIGHQEVVLVNYEASKISLEEILRVYLRNVDPLDGDGQFCDRGDSYRPVIFFNDDNEENIALNAISSAAIELSVPIEQIEIELKKRSKFWKAEDYHQDFADNNELKYKFYRYACGRDKRLDQLWGENARSINSWNN
tara:strand:- start:327 stop:929 length:603 start_codon:yes stop_codon:yes gene_type:complete